MVAMVVRASRKVVHGGHWVSQTMIQEFFFVVVVVDN